MHILSPSHVTKYFPSTLQNSTYFLFSLIYTLGKCLDKVWTIYFYNKYEFPRKNALNLLKLASEQMSIK